jgi:hypothetical protein
MTSATFAPAFPIPVILVRELLPWAVFAGLILLLAISFDGEPQVEHAIAFEAQMDLARVRCLLRSQRAA